MKIWTSYYGMLEKIKDIHPDYFLVSTSGAIPGEIMASVDAWEKPLAPSWSIYKEYKDDPNWKIYTRRFKQEILPHIDWMEYLEKWEEIANKIGKNLDNVVILCYEKPTDFCHRNILAESIEEEFRTEVREIGLKNMLRVNYKWEMESAADALF